MPPLSQASPVPHSDDVAAAISDLLSQGPTDAFAFEITLAQLAHAARTDRTALSAALMPVIDKGLAPQLGRAHGLDLPLATPLRQLHALAVNAVWLPPAAARQPRDSGEFELARIFRRLSLTLDRPPGMDPYALRTPADILTLRLAELAAHIADPVPLVSTPTDARGWIDPAVLVARVEEAETAGWQPLPLDFDQALLRLPDSGDSPESPAPAAMQAAQRLVSPAGRRLAGWLRGGHPALPEFDAADPAAARRQLTGPLAPSTLIHLLRRGWYPAQPMADGACWTICWPALLPGRPDLIAIAAAWHGRHPDAHGGSCPGPVLSRAASDSRHGHSDGGLAAIAHAITSRSSAKRTDAAQALAVLAASGHLDARRFGAALAAFATRTDRQFLRSAVPALQHALQTSADLDTSAIGMAILGWLPAVLPPAVDQPLPYTSHLLNLAADALTSTRTRKRPKPKPSPTVRTAIDALTNLANRPSRSQVSDAAQRLLTVLTQAS